MVLMVPYLAPQPRHESVLPAILTHASTLPAKHPRDGEALKPGSLYAAPNDRHLLVEPGKVRVVRGPKENGHRRGGGPGGRALPGHAPQRAGVRPGGPPRAAEGAGAAAGAAGGHAGEASRGGPPAPLPADGGGSEDRHAGRGHGGR
ncbi:hypothetical protein HPC49_32525 [Pyxidicoccus fallax]|uniref:CheB-type methylesterase domain-containing protein n=1 Tax=Pyxidicoccus fallax TaxID=394095 RepID=A0A848LG29_9BACT|nr:hypothetical protein [Pyxidicoccus fallax]NPC82936.1 hypothetical protein [Pyxidicoccus fallax]